MRSRTAGFLILLTAAVLAALGRFAITPDDVGGTPTSRSRPEARLDPRITPPIADARYVVARLETTAPSAARAVAPTAPSRSLVVSVLDAAQRTVPGARVSAQVAGRRLDSVSTDSEGDVTLDLAGVENELEVTVEAAGYETWFLSLTEPLPERVEARLALGSSLDGRVFWDRGTPAGAGITILAWPRGFAPRTDAAKAHLGGAIAPGARVVRTDEQGRFRFEGLPASGSWVVSAVGAGALRLRRGVVHLPHVGELRVDVTLAYAVGVRLKAEGGEPLGTSSELFGGGAGFHTPGHSHRFVPPIRVAPELAALGIPTDLVESERARDERILVLSSSERETGPVPVAYGADVPGYGPVWTELAAVPLSKDVPVYALEAERTATGFGPLDVRFRGSALGLLREVPVDRPFGRLFLTDVETGETSVLVVERGRGLEQRFDAIPYGEYRVGFQLREGGYAYPSDGDPELGVRVDGGEATVEIPVEDVGSLRLLLVEPDGDDYTGSAMFTLVERHSRRVVYNSFARAPYSVEGIPPGEYEVGLESLSGFERDAVGPLEVFIGENQGHYELVQLVR